MHFGLSIGQKLYQQTLLLILQVTFYIMSKEDTANMEMM